MIYCKKLRSKFYKADIIMEPYMGNITSSIIMRIPVSVIQLNVLTDVRNKSDI